MFSPSYCVFRHPQPGLPGTFPLPPGLDGRLAEGPRRGRPPRPLQSPSGLGVSPSLLLLCEAADGVTGLSPPRPQASAFLPPIRCPPGPEETDPPSVRLTRPFCCPSPGDPAYPLGPIFQALLADRGPRGATSPSPLHPPAGKHQPRGRPQSRWLQALGVAWPAPWGRGWAGRHTRLYSF